MDQTSQADRAESALPVGTSEGALEFGGLRRTYLLHKPASYDGRKPVPLVLAFHGRFGTGRLMEEMTRFSDISERDGFIVAYPDGISRSWNAGHGIGKASELGIDDVGFVTKLIDSLTDSLAIDSSRVYLAGMSNGAVFAYRLACTIGAKLAAIGVVAGAIASAIAENCVPTHPISILHIHGTADPIAPWDSGGPVLSVAGTIQRWVEWNDCSTDPHVTLQKGQVTCMTYRGCGAGAEVSLCRIEGGGHTWPGSSPLTAWRSILGSTNEDIDASEFIWDFFAFHSLPASHGSADSVDNVGEVSQGKQSGMSAEVAHCDQIDGTRFAQVDEEVSGAIKPLDETD
jgi:polyhydroxybutyrate depolymerase